MEYLKGRNALVHRIEADDDIYSDCEDDSTGVGDETLEEEQGGEEERAVLAGSFPACVHFLASVSH